MEVVLPLDKMTAAEKLHVLEQIWEDLCRTAEIPSPAWHGEILEAREGQVLKGSAHFADWNEAKRRLREETQ